MITVLTHHHCPAVNFPVMPAWPLAALLLVTQLSFVRAGPSTHASHVEHSSDAAARIAELSCSSRGRLIVIALRPSAAALPASSGGRNRPVPSVPIGSVKKRNRRPSVLNGSVGSVYVIKRHHFVDDVMKRHRNV